MSKLIAGFLGLFLNGLAIALPLQELQLPPGFSIDIYAQVPNARQIALGANGIVFVGTDSGKVYAVVPNANQTKAQQVITIASGLNTPNGVAYRDSALYVAETNRVLRYDNIEQHLSKPPTPTIITEQLPDKSWHGKRYIKFSPDGWLYIGVGVPCNVCLLSDPRFGTILRMPRDGKELQIYTKGVRNTVGFDWDPRTKHLWFTENGRDMMGDNIPPDKLDYASHSGLDFGFPYYHGDNILDPKYGKMRSSLQGITQPALNLPAHVAVLGMTFYTGKMFPEKYHDQIFIAEHGSWNRSQKIGYQVIWVEIKSNKALAWHPFVTGWLQGQTAWGRPVDVLVMPDGALLISDDEAGVLYRVSYR